jgi:hypothetical protein
MWLLTTLLTTVICWLQDLYIHAVDLYKLGYINIAVCRQSFYEPSRTRLLYAELEYTEIRFVPANDTPVIRLDVTPFTDAYYNITRVSTIFTLSQWYRRLCVNPLKIKLYYMYKGDVFHSYIDFETEIDSVTNSPVDYVTFDELSMLKCD